MHVKVTEWNLNFDLTWAKYMEAFLISVFESYNDVRVMMASVLRMFMQQSVSVFDESFFASAEEFLASISAMYPVTSRFIHRNFNSTLMTVLSLFKGH